MRGKSSAGWRRTSGGSREVDHESDTCIALNARYILTRGAEEARGEEVDSQVVTNDKCRCEARCAARMDVVGPIVHWSTVAAFRTICSECVCVCGKRQG